MRVHEQEAEELLRILLLRLRVRRRRARGQRLRQAGRRSALSLID